MSERSDSVVHVVGQVNHVVLVIEKTILVVFMVGMLVFGFLQVFSRFILKAPIGWSEKPGYTLFDKWTGEYILQGSTNRSSGNN